MFIKMKGYYFKDEKEEVLCIPYLFNLTRWRDGRFILNDNPNNLEDTILSIIENRKNIKKRIRERNIKIIDIPNQYALEFVECCYEPTFLFEGDTKKRFEMIKKILDFAKHKLGNGLENF